MTREEAKEELQSMCDHLHAHGICDKDSNMLTACKMAISALEQKPYDVQKIYDLKTGLSDWDVLPKLEQKPCEDIAQERYKDLCEYFGGAKDILKSREDFKAWLGRVKWHIRKAEELYEKYEYKKEPCDDAVSRKPNCIDCIHKSVCFRLDMRVDSDYAEKCGDFLTELPSVTQKPIEYEDAISREAVYQLLMNMASSAYGFEEIRRIVDDLPPVTQKSETVTEFADRCRECGKMRKGHWIYDETIDNWRCSKCNETPKTMGYVGTADFMAEHFKFCNHCGTRMVEPQESEDKE